MTRIMTTMARTDTETVLTMRSWVSNGSVIARRTTGTMSDAVVVTSLVMSGGDVLLVPEV